MPNAGNESITVYPRTASGNTSPVRTLAGVVTGLSGAEAVVVDTVNNELVVPNNKNNFITVYPRTASGPTAPVRTISGAATQLTFPLAVVVDTANDELSLDLTVTSAAGVSGAGSGTAAIATNPLTINYSASGCSGREMFVIVSAPPLGIPLSYYSGGATHPLPDPLSLITPFVTGGPLTTNGTHTLFSGSLPAGNYTVVVPATPPSTATSTSRSRRSASTARSTCSR